MSGAQFLGLLKKLIVVTQDPRVLLFLYTGLSGTCGTSHGLCQIVCSTDQNVNKKKKTMNEN